MVESYRNINDVIDHLTARGVYVTNVDHHGEPEDYNTFKLTVEVPHYERLELEDTDTPESGVE